MDVALGLLGMLVWIAAVIALAASVTFVVVKLFPAERPAKPTDAQPS